MFLVSVSVNQLLTNGVHIGHNDAQSNSYLDNYFVGKRYRTVILNVVYSLLILRMAILELSSVVITCGSVLFVTSNGFNTEVFFYLRRRIYMVAEPFWKGKGISGFLTNRKRLFWAYCKFLMSSRLNRRQKRLLSILDLDVPLYALPGIVIALHHLSGRLVSQEATGLRIPVVGLMDSDYSPAGIMYPILSNDDSHLVHSFFVLLFTKFIMVQKMVRYLKFRNLKI